MACRAELHRLVSEMPNRAKIHFESSGKGDPPKPVLFDVEVGCGRCGDKDVGPTYFMLWRNGDLDVILDQEEFEGLYAAMGRALRFVQENQ